MALQPQDLVYRPSGNFPFRPAESYTPASFNLDDQNYAAIQDARYRRAANEQEYQQNAPYYYDNERRFGQVAEDAWAPTLRGEGGFTPEEIARMEAAGDWRNFDAGPDPNYNDWYLTPDEQRGIAGDPFAALDYVDRAGTRMRGYADDARTRQQQALDRTTAETEGAVDPSLFMPDQGDLERIYSAQSPSLRLSEGFAETYPMSDMEVDQFGELAGRAANHTYQADRDEIARRAEAGGGTSAMALASLSERMRRQGAGAKADALGSARLNALALQRDQRRQAEQMRIDAERGYSAMGLESGRTAADLRQRGGANLSDARMRRGFGLGDIATDNARYDADRGMDINTWEGDRGAGYTQAGDEARSRRTSELGVNRQGTARDVAGDRYGRRLDTAQFNQSQADRRYGRERDVAGERLTDTRRGQEYATGQQRYYGDRLTQQQDVRDRNRALYGQEEQDSRDRQVGIKRSGRLSGFTNAMSQAAADAMFKRA